MSTRVEAYARDVKVGEKFALGRYEPAWYTRVRNEWYHDGAIVVRSELTNDTQTLLGNRIVWIPEVTR